MQFQVPQFIEMEDTVFGSFTFRQFLYLAGGAGLCFIWYVYLPIYLSIFFILASAGLALALAFYKYNGRNFIFLAESATKYFVASKLYLWKQSSSAEANNQTMSKKKAVAADGVALPRLSESKLKDLSWSLDVQSGQENLNQDSETL